MCDKVAQKIIHEQPALHYSDNCSCNALPHSPSLSKAGIIFVTCTPTYKSKKAKKLGIMITCGGSDPEKMKEIIGNAVVFFPQVAEKQMVVFNKCSSEEEHCKKTPEFLKTAKEIGIWATE